MPHTLRAAAVFLTALSLGPALAHLFALPNMMAMTRDAYFTAQAIYRGWNLLGLVLVLQAAALVALIAVSRRDRRTAGIALLGLAGAQALFWAYTFPANQATAS